MGEITARGSHNRVLITGRVLLRNSLLNLMGQVVPLLVGVATVPLIIRGLGPERFGLLSIAWMVLSYSAVFDLGLGRATTKFVAEALGKGEEEEIRRIVWTSVTVQTLLGVVGGLALAGITPLLVERLLKMPPELVSEAKATFYLLSLSVPVVLVSGSFSGVLEASQRFDLVNAVKLPSSVLTFLLPLVGLHFGLRLPGIVALILMARVGALLTYVAINLHLAPELRRYAGSLSIFPRLLSFGGWVTVSSIVGPILVYLDRFLIGALLSMAAVAYYSAPYEAVTRLWIIPASLTTTLFPAFSSLEGIRDKQRLSNLFARSLKYILILLGPIVLAIALFAKDILQMWLGSDFATKSTLALQVLAVGLLINSLAYIPFALLQGTGRPDLPAKFHLLELPLYIGAAWFLVSRWGIAGAACAWTLRMALDALLLFAAAFKVHGFALYLLGRNGLILASFAFLTLAGTGFALKALTGAFPLITQLLLILSVFTLFAWLCWRKVLDHPERETMFMLLQLWRRPIT